MSATSSDLPDVFLPYQQELWQTVDANAVTVIEKSRRTGYSWRWRRSRPRMPRPRAPMAAPTRSTWATRRT